MTLAAYYKLHNREIEKLILEALKEDKAAADVTTNLLFGEKRLKKRINAVLLCKEDCVLAGLEIFKMVFELFDRRFLYKANFKDGDKLRSKDKVIEISASLSTLLRCERTALNFIQRMSGIATLTSEFVKKLKFKDSYIL